MNIFDWLPELLLVFSRISAFLLVTPIFGRNVPAQVKVGFSAFLAIVSWLTMTDQDDLVFDTAYIGMILREVLVGLALGYLTVLFFAILQIAGAFIDLQMGLGIASVLDPVTGNQSPLMGNFKYILGLLIFISINGHHLLIRGIINSYRWIPLQGESVIRVIDGNVSEFLLRSLGMVFLLAFQLASPFIAVMFLIDLCLGILAKTSPQMNIFVIGVPIKILVGFAMFVVLIPGFFALFQALFERMLTGMDQLMQVVGG
jgi:flagellar biosynthetic protein FliR